MISIAIAKLSPVALLTIFFQPCSTSTKPEAGLDKVAEMQTPRAVHTVTTLQSGQVLIVGGMTNGGGSLADVEVFDPASNAIRDLGSLAEARVGHTATRLTDGRVLIAGGQNPDYLRSVEIFDPVTLRFRRAGSLLEGRSGHTATLLSDGRVLFVGGVGKGWTFLPSAELYDPATGRSAPVGSMSVPRESHTATLLKDGRVLVIGGHSGRRPNMQVYASAEVFSPQTGRFQPAGTLATARHKHDAIMLADGRVLVIGGADRSDRVYFRTTEIYAPGSATFERGPSMAHSRYKIAGTSILLANGDVLVTSGARTPEILDRGKAVFREMDGSFPDAYRYAAAAHLAGGDVVVTGGYTDANRNTGGVWRLQHEKLRSP